LLGPILTFAQTHELEAKLLEALPDAKSRDAFCSIRQVAALLDTARALDQPARYAVRLVALLVDDPTPDPTELALELGVPAFCDGLRELLRLRLGTPGSRRCRTSVHIARGALQALAQVAPDEEAILGSAMQVLSAETRRAGKGEPVLALQALEVLKQAPALAQVRLLTPLVPRLKRRKVATRAEEVLEAAASAAGLSTEDRTELTARRGGADDDGWARVPLEEGGETRVRIAVHGEIERDGEAPCSIDARAIDSAERTLLSTWEEHARRLERALVSGRTWPAVLWREIFAAGHPLWADLLKRLVWEVIGTDERLPFVWREGPVDLFGDPVELAQESRVGLLHPSTLDTDELELWREHARERVAETGVTAPFAQIFRDVKPITDDPFERFLNRAAHQDAIGAMARLSGWSGAPLLGDGPWLIERGFKGRDLAVTVDLEHLKVAFRATLAQRRTAHRRKKDGEKAVVRAPKDDRPRATLKAIEIHGSPDAHRIGLSEIVRDLERLTDPLNTVTNLFLRAWQKRKWKDATEAWREIVLAYRRGSPALLEIRRVLLQAFLAREGLEARLEDRFAITGRWVVELGTGLCHEGVEKHHLPTWKVDELAAKGSDGHDPVPFPFRRAAEPETVIVVERIIGLARAAALGIGDEDDDDDEDDDEDED
jgi:hypothetical protein